MFALMLAFLAYFPISLSLIELTPSFLEKNGEIFSFNDKYLQKFVKEIGYENYSLSRIRPTRNFDGSELWLAKERNILIISSNGNVKEMALPPHTTTNYLINYELNVWLNKQHEVIAWISNNKLLYKNEKTMKDPSFVSSVANWKGAYFSRGHPPIMKEEGVLLYSIEAPDTPIAEIDTMGLGRRYVFTKNNTIYLFDHEVRGGPQICFILSRKNFSLAIERKVEIPGSETWLAERPRSLFALDVCPWKNEVLLLDSLDFPTKSKLYVFNLDTHRLKKTGTYKGYSFYLQGNIFKNAVERYKRQKPMDRLNRRS